MSELRDLYQEVILDHGKRPRNCGALDKADSEASGHNPLCGDKIKIFVKIRDGRIEEATFEGNGCAISTAAASMMTTAVRGKTHEEVEQMFRAFQEMVTGKTGVEELSELPPKLVVFDGVREFPMRVKCATLSWHTLRAALDRQRDTVTTES